jgi:undecaprenyl diphosphate synthase
MTAKKVPQCVGIILDGNRRWAKQKGLSQLQGHTAGMDNLERIVRALSAYGTKHVVVYAFSTENWKRSEEEVSHLMGLVLEFAEKHLKKLIEEKVRVRFAGQRGKLAPDVRAAVERIEAESRGGACTLWVCLSYGGRAEIVEAARAMQQGGEEITEESFAERLWTAGMPDPDLIIRTGGEKRLSNFLAWQSAYSELFFTDTFWPDFSESELQRILDEYAERERRMGT